jgi:hypothetical protein
MRNSLIVAGVAAALAASIGPSKAEPLANAYPYCLLGRGGGSTTCYFRSRAECGNGCINNPGYVGDQRAQAILGGARVAAAGNRTMARTNSDRRTLTLKMMIGPIDSGARASVSHGDDFAGWPTDYLVNRFGDHQAQGRF